MSNLDLFDDSKRITLKVVFLSIFGIFSSIFGAYGAKHCIVISDFSPDFQVFVYLSAFVALWLFISFLVFRSTVHPILSGILNRYLVISTLLLAVYLLVVFFVYYFGARFYMDVVNIVFVGFYALTQLYVWLGTLRGSKQSY